MAASFCFRPPTNDGNYTATFKSTDGEEYILNYKKSDRVVRGFGRSSETTVYIVWKAVSSKFIKASFYYEDQFNHDKTLIVKDTTRATIPYVANGSVMVVNITPFVHLTEEKSRAAEESADQKLVPKKTQPTTECKLEQLSQDMRNLLQTGKLSDIVLTDGAKEIRAHKLILSTRSSVFDKMFQHPMKENRENRITIKDVRIEILKELLHFIYTGTVTIKNSTVARELYIASDKYDVQELRGICSTMLTSVDLNNVFDTLLLGDLYSDKVLKEAALKFISGNYSQLKQLQNWNSFMKENQSLAIEILSFVIDKKV